MELDAACLRLYCITSDFLKTYFAVNMYTVWSAMCSHSCWPGLAIGTTASANYHMLQTVQFYSLAFWLCNTCFCFDFGFGHPLFVLIYWHSCLGCGCTSVSGLLKKTQWIFSFLRLTLYFPGMTSLSQVSI